MKALIAAVAVLASIAAFGGNSAESARPQPVQRDFSPWVKDGAIAQSNRVCMRHGRGECIGTAQCQSMGGACGGSC